MTDERSRVPLAAGAVALGAAAAWCWPAPAPLVPAIAPALGIPCRLSRPTGIAITFDDGPHPEGTPAVLEALAEAGATATFFLVGEQVERRPALAREVHDAGHEVALHCHRHRNPLRLTPGQARDDVRRAAETIAEATGQAPRLYRPPYGAITAATLVVARRQGLRPILWTCDPHDWRADSTPERIAGACLDLRAGEIVLLHDSDAYGSPGSWKRTTAALPRILTMLEAHGLSPAAI
jgi:peptidoglycan/xylan/chitin deacetylase (PgdA/CDA1 family)